MNDAIEDEFSSVVLIQSRCMQANNSLCKFTKQFRSAISIESTPDKNSSDLRDLKMKS